MLELSLGGQVDVLQAKRSAGGGSGLGSLQVDSRTVQGATGLTGEGLVYALGSRSGCD